MLQPDNFQTPIPEQELVIFLSKRKYFVSDKENPDKKIEIWAFTYMNLDTDDLRELSIREENLLERRANEITFGDNWVFRIFRIQREWVKNGNYQNLKLLGIDPLDEFMRLEKVEKISA